ncbi:hypothetical protein LXL04_006458 [Taraxacum kok-saghyz]
MSISSDDWNPTQINSRNSIFFDLAKNIMTVDKVYGFQSDPITSDPTEPDRTAESRTRRSPNAETKNNRNQSKRNNVFTISASLWQQLSKILI